MLVVARAMEAVVIEGCFDGDYVNEQIRPSVRVQASFIHSFIHGAGNHMLGFPK
jgi:hypothetical protein